MTDIEFDPRTLRNDLALLKIETNAFPATTPERVFGCLHYNGPPKSVEEMKAGIAAEARRRHARDRY